MDKDEALHLIEKRNWHLWDQYRKLHPDWCPDLSEVKFGTAGLTVFDLSNANLCGSDLSSARLVSKLEDGSEIRSNLHNAKYDIRTIFPDGFNAVAARAQFVTRKEREKEIRSRSSVFISYARSDGKIVRAIDQWLWSKGIETHIDDRDFFAGPELQDEVMRVMRACDVILVVLSAASSGRKWPTFEREFAKQLTHTAKREGLNPPQLIYVAIDDTPYPSDSATERLNIVAKGRNFPSVCDEIHRSILKIPGSKAEMNLDEFNDYVFR